MSKGQGFFQGEKKKKKKGEGMQQFSTAPVFTPPQVLPKRKDKY